MDFQWIRDSTMTEIVLLLIAFAFSAIIGIEREFRHKNAGARTHILVGVGSALFTLVSAYGFEGMVSADSPYDPGRIAAQIVTGIGFLGAGVVFVRRNIVAGLTTAASIWVVAAVGMACGAGMPTIAAVTVVLYLISVTLFTAVVRKIREPNRERTLRIRYLEGHGMLRSILESATRLGYTANLLNTTRLTGHENPVIEATMQFVHEKPIGQGELFEVISELAGVVKVDSLSEDDLSKEA